MRGFVLLLLGGGLVWWIWSGLGSSEAHEADRSPVPEPVEAPDLPRGQMLSPPPELAEPERAPDPEPEPRAPRAAERAPLERPPAERPRAGAQDDRRPLGQPTAGAHEDALGIAACLLHRPHELPQVLAAQGAALSKDRQRLVLAYAHAIDGRFGRAYELASGLETSREITSEEWDLCRALIAEDSSPRAVSAAAGTAHSPLLLAATMAWMAQEAGRELKGGGYREAALGYSELLLQELDAPWPADTETLQGWMDGLARAQAGHRWNRDGEWASLQATVQQGDSLVAIRRRVLRERPDLLLCTGLIARANELRGSVIHPGDQLRIPTDRPHALVDLDARTACFLMGDEVVAAWIVGIGREGNETRPGTYVIGDKEEEPMWWPPGQDPVPFGEEGNPLGTRWLAWEDADGVKSTLGFHGTSDPGGVGQAVSQGCIRMHNRDVEELFEILPRGAAVVVRP